MYNVQRVKRMWCRNLFTSVKMCEYAFFRRLFKILKSLRVKTFSRYVVDRVSIINENGRCTETYKIRIFLKSDNSLSLAYKLYVYMCMCVCIYILLRIKLFST